MGQTTRGNFMKIYTTNCAKCGSGNTEMVINYDVAMLGQKQCSDCGHHTFVPFSEETDMPTMQKLYYERVPNRRKFLKLLLVQGKDIINMGISDQYALETIQ